MPAISPPPPTGTNTAARSAGAWRRISTADRALPGDDQRVVERVDEDSPLSAAERSACCCASA